MREENIRTPHYNARVRWSTHHALYTAMRITNPKTRARTFLKLARPIGKAYPGNLSSLLDVHPAVVRCVLRSLHFTECTEGDFTGWWFPSLDTLRALRDG